MLTIEQWIYENNSALENLDEIVEEVLCFYKSFTGNKMEYKGNDRLDVNELFQMTQKENCDSSNDSFKHELHEMMKKMEESSMPNIES